MPDKRTKKAESGSAGFEESLGQLEKVVGEMESGRLSLDEMMARFEEGQTLIAHCTRRLNEVEKRVEQLVKQGDRDETRPFEADGLADEEGGGESEEEDEEEEETDADGKTPGVPF
jgi:exodeoxyribonuclease VII small subunit